MILKAPLTAWILAASVLSSGGARKLQEPVAEAMADAAIAGADGSDDLARTLASFEVSLAWHEGSNEQNPHGPNDGGHSHCWAQIYLATPATRTLEGWTGAELRADPAKCATVAVRILKSSISDRRAPLDCPLCIYARGFRWLGDPAVLLEARHLSKTRTDLARRLLREVPWSD